MREKLIELKLTKEMVDDLLMACGRNECDHICRFGFPGRWKILIDVIKEQMERQEVGA